MGWGIRGDFLSAHPIERTTARVMRFRSAGVPSSRAPSSTNVVALILADAVASFAGVGKLFVRRRVVTPWSKRSAVSSFYFFMTFGTKPFNSRCRQPLFCACFSPHARDARKKGLTRRLLEWKGGGVWSIITTRFVFGCFSRKCRHVWCFIGSPFPCLTCFTLMALIKGSRNQSTEYGTGQQWM